MVDEARRWLGTPYHHRASVLGVGVDCALLLREAFAGAGVIDSFITPQYTSDWHLHRGEEKYLATVEAFCQPIPLPFGCLRDAPDSFNLPPATVLMWQVGRTYSHSGLVTQWPFIIHSYLPSRIVEEVDVRGTPMAFRPVKAYSRWEDSI